eukprot:TRINITY_DN1598_c0_g4_i1.p1 TRINITY_DN1598_c0_g4~~TRINITY_DN1598_c0_g4_i1.p1  ORF type:complete len:624 (+),score=158.41 TRINITY_DN1598_c0_g4_i1:37-1908(+)
MTDRIKEFIEEINWEQIQDSVTDIVLDYKCLASSIALLCGAKVAKQVINYVKERNIILELDLSRMKIRETGVNDVIGSYIASDIVPFTDILDAIIAAKNDWRIKGIIIDVSDIIPLGLAQYQELMAALTSFKETKPIIAICDSFGEAGPGIISYAIASIATKIYMAPCGHLGLVGLSITHPFLKNMLEKLKIEPVFKKRGNFKNAANLFTHDTFDEYHKERSEMLLSEITEMLAEEISKARPILGSTEEVMELIVNGPYLPDQAVELNLIDDLRYQEDLYEDFSEDFGLPKKKIKFLYLSRYFKKIKRSGFLGFGKGHKVAVITCEGNIYRGKNNNSWEDQIIGHETTVNAIEDAAKDKSVKAILLRVDSGGGSYIASDQIANSIIRAKQKGKKVVVSMGNVAASGGYFISQNADCIVSNPLTITGSIGVVSGKFNLREMFAQHLGVTFDKIVQGESSNLFSPLENYSEENEVKMEKFMDQIYNDFKKKAGEGRNIPFEEMEELAQGKIWMGRQAAGNNLIDVLGGYHVALEEVKRLLALKETDKLNIVHYPQQSMTDLLLSEGKKNSRESETASLSVTKLLENQILFNPIKQVLRNIGISTSQLSSLQGGIQLSCESPLIRN